MPTPQTKTCRRRSRSGPARRCRNPSFASCRTSVIPSSYNQCPRRVSSTAKKPSMPSSSGAGAQSEVVADHRSRRVAQAAPAADPRARTRGAAARNASIDRIPFLGLDRADRVDQPAARGARGRRRRAGSRRCAIAVHGQIVGRQAPADLGMTAQRPRAAARRIDEHVVERRTENGAGSRHVGGDATTAPARMRSTFWMSRDRPLTAAGRSRRPARPAATAPRGRASSPRAPRTHRARAGPTALPNSDTASCDASSWIQNAPSRTGPACAAERRRRRAARRGRSGTRSAADALGRERGARARQGPAAVHAASTVAAGSIVRGEKRVGAIPSEASHDALRPPHRVRAVQGERLDVPGGGAGGSRPRARARSTAGRR